MNTSGVDGLRKMRGLGELHETREDAQPVDVPNGFWENTSGLRPCEFNVVIRPDPVEQKTKGGLILSDETMDRNKHAATRGTMVAMSPLAFDETVWPAGEPKPAVGARVLIAKHAGTFCEGMDGEEYRIVKDKDVVALIEGER